MDRRAFITSAPAALLGLPASAHTGEIHIAVAANFTTTAQKLASVFHAHGGHKVIHTFGSSGQFYAQIRNGAPFDLFLSADAERPRRLEKEGVGVPYTRFTYARGALALWSTDGRVDSKGAILSSGRFEKLAIADPASAPYGKAAEQTLRYLGLRDRLAPRIVKGSSISQAYQFVASGAAELGFVALSQIKTASGSHWRVPQTHYSPIDQQAILLRDSPAARAYMTFLRSPEAVRLIRADGYEVP